MCVLKLFVSLSLCLALTILCTGCSTQDTASEQPLETVITFKALPLPDLFVDIPEDYQVTSSNAYKEYYVCDDASIIITEDKRKANYPSAYEYSIMALNEYEKIASTLTYLNSESIPASGYDVRTLEFDYTIGEGDEAAKLTCLAGYLTDGLSMYIITCKSNTETYQSHRQEFVSVMQSAVIAR